MIFKWVKNYKEKREKEKSKNEARLAQEKAEERIKMERIRKGDLKPINIDFHLLEGEKAYAEFKVRRIATVEHTVGQTSTKLRKKGVITRAVVGGVLLGPIGALGGAATAGNKSESTTTYQKSEVPKEVDKGRVVFTDKRIIFIGQQVLSLTYGEVLKLEFFESGPSLVIQYPGMLKGEYYDVTSPEAKFIEAYYEGIRKKSFNV